MSDINYRERISEVLVRAKNAAVESIGFLGDIASTIRSKIIYDDNIVIKEQPYNDLLYAVEAAKQEWLTSKEYFESVTDPDLVDHAVYLMEASQKKYMYLLKKARKEGVKVEF